MIPSLSKLVRTLSPFLLPLLLDLGFHPACDGRGVVAMEVESDGATRTALAAETDNFRLRLPPTPHPESDDRADGADGDQCGCYVPPGGPTAGGARLAYLISVHNSRTLDDASYLFRALRYPSTIIIVHIDKKVEPDAYANSTLRREVDDCPCGADVYVDSLFSPEWGEWSMNDPTHWAMDVLVSHPRFRDKWDIFLNLSGDTMPVLTPDVMASLFDPDEGQLSGINFVTSSACETGFIPTNVWLFPKKWHKRTHYTFTPEGDYIGDPIIKYVDDDGRERTQIMTTHFGSQWMALQADFVRYLAMSLKREDSLPSQYKADLIDLERLMADETFVATVLMNVHPFNETLPDLLPGGNLASLPEMYAIRYERMDEHYPTAFGLVPVQQRYAVPNSSACDETRPWGPYFLGVYDLSNIRRSGALFVRKVSVHLDPNIVHMLPVRSHDDIPDIQWPEEVKVTEKVDWGKRMAFGRKKIAEEKAKKAKQAQKKAGDEDGEEGADSVEDVTPDDGTKTGDKEEETNDRHVDKNAEEKPKNRAFDKKEEAFKKAKPPKKRKERRAINET